MLQPFFAETEKEKYQRLSPCLFSLFFSTPSRRHEEPNLNRGISRDSTLSTNYSNFYGMLRVIGYEARWFKNPTSSRGYDGLLEVSIDEHSGGGKRG